MLTGVIFTPHMAALCPLSLQLPSETYVGRRPKSSNARPRNLLQWVAADEYTRCQQNFYSLQIQRSTRCQKILREKSKNEHFVLAEHNLYLGEKKVFQSPDLHEFRCPPKFCIVLHKIDIFQMGTIPRAWQKEDVHLGRDMDTTLELLWNSDKCHPPTLLSGSSVDFLSFLETRLRVVAYRFSPFSVFRLQ